MYSEPSIFQKVRFYTNISVLYLLTIVFGIYLALSTPLFNPDGVVLARSAQIPYLPNVGHFKLIAGKPVRLVIPASAIDLPVDEGYYNSADHSWTLSGYHAQFAMISTLANNRSGDTFIYGHNNNNVFGALRHVTPIPGATALIYTDNGRVFAYKFQAANSVAPDDTSVLQYHGKPMLTIQTCTGSVNEWRTLYRFSFAEVVQ